MKEETHHFSFDVYDSSGELSEDDAVLLQAAQEVSKLAYAPYSQFRVGAAAKLSNGKIVTGSNQENASYPAGLCAERVLLSAASSLYPASAINTIAISYHSASSQSDHPIAPCGICRQTLLEYESRTNQPIRLILGGMQGKVYVIPDAAILMPLSFTINDLS